MKILVTGANGNLGRELVSRLGQAHKIISTDVETLDITDFTTVKSFIHDNQPDLIINPAAWTDVDGCALNPEKAIVINGYGAQNLAIAANEIGAEILQISSNEVFDGLSKRPYYEYDQTNPANPYGYSKWVSERAVIETNPHHYIVRTAWLFAHGGRNFIQAILGAADAGKKLRVVTDEVANPTYTNDVADAIAQLIETERYGTYHLVNEGAVSRYAFARYALDKAGYTDTPIEPISSHQWQRPSRPPLYSGLANIAAKSIGITLRPWQAAVDTFLAMENLLIAE